MKSLADMLAERELQPQVSEQASLPSIQMLSNSLPSSLPSNLVSSSQVESQPLSIGQASLSIGQASLSIRQVSGSKGGKVRAERLSPERRREIAQKASATRWAKRHKTGIGFSPQYEY